MSTAATDAASAVEAVPLDTTATSAEPTAPAAEPTPAATEPTPTPEPVEAAPPEPVADTAPEPTPALPDPATFKWDEWDGQDYEAFPEEIRPWVTPFQDRITAATAEAAKQEQYWKAMYEAQSGFGVEDPRVAQTQTELQTLQAVHNTMKAEYDKLVQTTAEEKERQEATYFKWFGEAGYNEKLQSLGESLGQDEAMKQLMALDDVGYQAHESVEIMLMSPQAAAEALDLVSRVKDTSIALEVLQARHGKPEPTPTPAPAGTLPKAPTPEPEPENPATSLVTGTTPVTTPTKLEEPKATPKYHVPEQRNAALQTLAQRVLKRAK